MFDLLSNPWLYVLLGLLLVFQNLVRALPKPGESPAPIGFGSSSPGYKFLYTFARGLSGDIRAAGFDPKALGNKAMAKYDPDATTRINPPQK